MAKKYYEILGVSNNASKIDIDKKYYSLVKKFHPDLAKNEQERDKKREKFKDISEAYSVISDEEKRKKYDQELKMESWGGKQSNNYEFHTTSFNGFESFFDFGSSPKNERTYSKERNYPNQVKGKDIEIIINLTFEEFILGTEKTIILDSKKSCTKCLQTGANNSSKNSLKICPSCKGRGISEQNILGFIFGGGNPFDEKCSKCEGSGKIIGEKCDLCRGVKFIWKKEYVKIKIPRGISEEQRLRKKGFGHDGLNSPEKGDLFIKIKLIEHKYFKKKDRDIYVNLPISFFDAIIGNKVKVMTIEGTEDIKVPEGSQFGDYIILKNKGVYKNDSKSRGNFFIKLQVELPRRISSERKDLFTKLWKETKWDPNKDFIDKNESKK